MTLEELAALEEKATPGPWKINDRHDQVCVYESNDRDVIVCSFGNLKNHEIAADAALIAAARNALPALLKIARAALACYEEDDFITDQGEAANMRDQALGVALAALGLA
jgi:hypothetical protein